MKIVAVSLCALLVAPGAAGASSTPGQAVDFPVEESYYISADDKDALVDELRRFVYNQLDRRTPLFAACLEGGALKDLPTAAMLDGTDISLTGDIVEAYLHTEGKDYTASLLSDYSSTVQCIYMFWDRETPFRIMIVYRVSWNEDINETRAVYDYARLCVTELIRPEMSSYERIKALHDFVVSSFSYDMSGNYEASASPYGMVKRGKGICSAYTGLMYQLVNAAGYRCRILLKDTFAQSDGSTDAHTWNLVEIDGVWYHIDATWDDPVSGDGSQYLLHDYFLKSDDYMRRTHSWDESAYPPAPDSFPLSKAKAGRASADVYAPVVDLAAVPVDLAETNGGPPSGFVWILNGVLPHVDDYTLSIGAAVIAAAFAITVLVRLARRRRS